MAKKTTQENLLGWALLGVTLLILYLMSKAGLLHESVTSSIVTAAGTTTTDPLTGFPQYDPRDPTTVPSGEGQKVAPIDANGVITSTPTDPATISCPIGTTPYHNVQDNTYWCIPS